MSDPARVAAEKALGQQLPAPRGSDPSGAAPTTSMTIPVTCTTCASGTGWANLRVSKVGGDITLDVHVAGACVIVLDEEAATALFDFLGEWLG